MEYAKIFTAKNEIEAQIIKGRLWDRGIQAYLKPNEANLNAGQPSFDLDWDIEVAKEDEKKAIEGIQDAIRKMANQNSKCSS